jgi:hypothetical protein
VVEPVVLSLWVEGIVMISFDVAEVVKTSFVVPLESLFREDVVKLSVDIAIDVSKTRAI